MSKITQSFYYDKGTLSPPGSSIRFMASGVSGDVGVTTEGGHYMNLPHDCKLVNVMIHSDVTGTLASSEFVNIAILKNSVTQIPISTTFQMNQASNTQSVDVDHDFLVTDHYSLAFFYPAFVTAPTLVTFIITLTFEIDDGSDRVYAWQRYFAAVDYLTPAKLSEYYFGANGGATASTISELHQFSFPFDGKIIGANLYKWGANYSSETVTVKLLKNSTTELAIADFDASGLTSLQTVEKDDISYDFVKTDKFSWYVAFPDWSTYPPGGSVWTYSLLLEIL